MRGVWEKFTSIIRNPLRANANYNLKSTIGNPQNQLVGDWELIYPLQYPIEIYNRIRNPIYPLGFLYIGTRSHVLACIYAYS